MKQQVLPCKWTSQTPKQDCLVEGGIQAEEEILHLDLHLKIYHQTMHVVSSVSHWNKQIFM